MKNEYYEPIVADINNLRVFIYSVKSHIDMMNYFLRISEVYIFDCFLGSAAKNVTIDDFINWNLILGHENYYQTNYYGLFMPDYHITQFYKTFSNSFTKEEKSVLKQLVLHECIVANGKKCDKTRQFAIIVINEELCKTMGETKEIILIHELSHALYRANKSYRTFINRVYDKTGVAYQTIMSTQLAERYNNMSDRLEDEWAAYILDDSLQLSKFKKYSEIDLKRVTNFFNNLLWSQTTIIQGSKHNILQKYIARLGTK